MEARHPIESSSTIHHAFKEWSVICRALAEGRQAIILRKGGIADVGGIFKPEHPRFLLFPTYLHQQAEAIKPEASKLIADAEADRAPADVVRFSHFAEVSGAFFVRHLEVALALDPLHLWSEATVRQRFAYRTPGLFVLAVRVQRLLCFQEVPTKPEFDGCKTWVNLGAGLPVDGATPVIDDRRYADFLEVLDRLSNPTARA
jgi:hypothetical protein